MANIKLNRIEACYIKCIYKLTIEEGKNLTSGYLARFFHVKIPSSIDVIERLRKKGYVKRKRYGSVELTPLGEKVATILMHSHRVLEVFLVDILKIELDEACRFADDIDYMIDQKVIKRLCMYLNRPNKCHHGKIIKHEFCGCAVNDR